MKIGTRMPPFSHQIGFDAYAAWLAENGFGAVDTPLLTRQIARTCERLGLAIGSSDGGGQVLSRDAAKRRKGLSEIKKSLSAIARHGGHTLFTVLGPDDPSMSKAETFEIFAKVYPRVVAHAEKVGVNIAIEPWPGGRPHYPQSGLLARELALDFCGVPVATAGHLLRSLPLRALADRLSAALARVWRPRAARPSQGHRDHAGKALRIRQLGRSIQLDLRVRRGLVALYHSLEKVRWTGTL